jgi:hypothetical protein
VFTAIGLNGSGRLGKTAAFVASSMLRWRQRRLARAV